MRSPPDRAGDASRAATADERDLYVRVREEFYEMPGLTLTVRQAVRLFGADQGHCERVLEALVADGILAADGARFARSWAGREGPARRP